MNEKDTRRYPQYDFVKNPIGMNDEWERTKKTREKLEKQVEERRRRRQQEGK